MDYRHVLLLQCQDAALAMHLQWMQDNSVQDVVMSNFVRVSHIATWLPLHAMGLT